MYYIMNKYITIEKPNNNFVKQKDIDIYFKTKDQLRSIKNIEDTIPRTRLRKSSKIRQYKIRFTKSSRSRSRNMNYKYLVHFD